MIQLTVLHAGPLRHLGPMILLAAVGLAGPAEAGPEGVERGRMLATRLCAACHMGEGQGEKVGPDGIPSFAAVARRPQQTREGIVDWLRSVPPMMPNHHLTHDETDALASFIISLR